MNAERWTRLIDAAADYAETQTRRMLMSDRPPRWVTEAQIALAWTVNVMLWVVVLYQRDSLGALDVAVLTTAGVAAVLSWATTVRYWWQR